jgi:hypothetical protein
MTDEETIEYERLKTARDSLLLTIANLRGQLETIAAVEREACATIADSGFGVIGSTIAQAIRARGEQA